MEVIYPRNTREDSSSAGVIGETDGYVVENSEINQIFNDWLTQYFSEDNSKTVIETINNYAAEMPNVGMDELLIAYMAKFETELKNIKEAIQNMDLGEKLIENHSIVDLGEFTWNDQTQHIYMLAGGVPSTITINQYINNICGVAIFGGEFVSKDAESGLIDLSLYPVDYIETLLANNSVLTIGGEKYVPLTICEITINNNELGDQLPTSTETEDNTSEILVDSGLPYLYTWWTTQIEISSDPQWFVPSTGQLDLIRKAILDGGSNVANFAGDVIKDIASETWRVETTGDNTKHLSLLGTGLREYDGGFAFRNNKNLIWSSTEANGFVAYCKATNYDSTSFADWTIDKRVGGEIRLVKVTEDADGSLTTYVGNNGREYSAIAYGGFYILTQSLQETKNRNGVALVNTIEDAEWVGLDSASFCVPDNGQFVQISNGGLTVVDNNDYSLFEIDPNSGLNEPKKVSELENGILTSLLLRKI